MSDRETILATIRRTERRLRTNSVLERLAFRLSIWICVGVVLEIADLIRPFSQSGARVLGISWVVGVVGLIAWSLAVRSTRQRAAAEVDRRAHLKDAVLSAWWFIDSGKDDGPWVGLHLHRTADRIRRIDISTLCPRVVPRLSFLGGIGLVLLFALHFLPLPFSGGQLLSGPRPPEDAFSDTKMLIDEIESLLARADALDPDGQDLDDFQRVMNELQDPEASLPDVDSELNDLQGALEEGNLSTAGILEGLEDMAQDLMAADETAAAGAALTTGNLEAAADQLEQLADSLAGAEQLSPALADALERAAEDARPGLEELAQSLGEAAEGLDSQDAQEAGEALSDAADALRNLSNLLESQDLRNQASDRIDSLREALEENAQGQNAGQPDAGGTPPEGSESRSEQQGPPGEGEAQPGESGGSEPNSADAAQPGTGDATAQGEPGENQDATGQPGSIEGAAGGDSGMLPAGLGFSPEQKVGEATSLEVQLQLEATAVAASLDEREPGPQTEEASRQEQSRVDYRRVSSELTPAQQELLTQEQIPREYRNLIREYFQAIRPPSEQ